jgi:photosystem II stability/assembly factor-like uncharacterized protein
MLNDVFAPSRARRVPPRVAVFPQLVLLAACQAGGAAVEREPFPGTFAAVASPAPVSLRGLAAIDAANAWVSGQGGVFRTVDGGRSWRDVTPPGSRERDFRDVEVVDPAHGGDTALAMVAGTPAEVWRTTDGGGTWTRVLADGREGAFFDAMAFEGPVGALFADPLGGVFQLWTTRDGGATWQPVAPERLPPPLPGEAAFAASGSCVHVERNGDDAFVRVVTGGAARARLLVGSLAGPFHAEDVPLQAGGSSRGAFGLARSPRGAWCVVGGDYAETAASERTVAFTAADEGPWSVVQNGAVGFRSAVVWLDDERLLAVGSHGCSGSADAGATWRSLGDVGFHAVARGGDFTVWACGSDGRVVRWLLAR